MNQPMVTVGIPTFNRPEGLRRSIEAVTKQSYPNLEILVADNHSEDAAAVMDALTPFGGDRRLKYFRHESNRGSVGNFHFLVGQATGEYFLWVADDDEIAPTYVERLLGPHLAESGVAISMTHYTQTDTMQDPPIHLNLSHFLEELQADTAGERMEKYLRQPDHFGKSRLVWGMYPTGMLRDIFSRCLATRRDRDKDAVWGDLPLEFDALSRGKLVMVPEVLFFVSLHPTSAGRAGLGVGKRLVEILKKSSHAYIQTIARSSENDRTKKKLRRIVRRKLLTNMPQLIGYYGLQSKFPVVARWIKVIFYWLTAGKSRGK